MCEMNSGLIREHNSKTSLIYTVDCGDPRLLERCRRFSREYTTEIRVMQADTVFLANYVGNTATKTIRIILVGCKQTPERSALSPIHRAKSPIHRAKVGYDGRAQPRGGVVGGAGGRQWPGWLHADGTYARTKHRGT